MVIRQHESDGKMNTKPAGDCKEWGHGGGAGYSRVWDVEKTVILNDEKTDIAALIRATTKAGFPSRLQEQLHG